jgi:PAS domain S-box-containing protein/putative nucleotidyltransferase with HDIG domain
LDATSEGLWDWDVDSGVAYFSPRYYTMLGYEPNAFEASYASWLKLLHPEDRGRAQEAIRERMRDENGAFEIEFRMRTADGSWRWILSRGRVVERHPDGRPLRMIGTHADVTSRHDAERALQRAFDGAIEAMARTTETRDPYTAGHQQRVTQLSCAIARELELDDRDISTLRIAGLLHDIGKISVPSEILAKPVRLSEPEFDMVRGHVESGYEILRRIEFPWPIADIVRQHHERLDGSGYPLGLRKDEIRPEARILAVADVVEAMATHRPYRAALGVEAALAEIERGAGDLFDPDVVAACLRLFRERSFTFDEAATDAR